MSIASVVQQFKHSKAGWLSLLLHVWAFTWEDSMVGSDLIAKGQNQLEVWLLSCLVANACCWLRPYLEHCISQGSLEKWNQLGSQACGG